MNLLLVYLLIVNVVGLVLMIADKQAAKNKRRRIPQKHLLLTAFVGGSIGVYLGMHLAHHKTRHKKFSVGVPIILTIQIIAFCVLVRFVPLEAFRIDLFPSGNTSSNFHEETATHHYGPGYDPKDDYNF